MHFVAAFSPYSGVNVDTKWAAEFVAAFSPYNGVNVATKLPALVGRSGMYPPTPFIRQVSDNPTPKRTRRGTVADSARTRNGLGPNP